MFQLIHYNDVKPSRKLVEKLDELGGRVTAVTDKTVELEFNTKTNARLFREAAEREGFQFI